MLILLSKHLRIVLLKVNRKYLEIAGFCIGVAVVINFTGFYGILISFTATSISILSSRFRVRSTHLMGVLLVSSIMAVMA
jgi:TctA family transporter